MLLLAIELSKGREHASNFTNSERKYKHKHFHNHEKTGSTLWFLTEFRRFFLTVTRVCTRVDLVTTVATRYVPRRMAWHEWESAIIRATTELQNLSPTRI